MRHCRGIGLYASRYDLNGGAVGLHKEGNSRNPQGGTLLRLLIGGKNANGDEDRESENGNDNGNKGGTLLALPNNIQMDCFNRFVIHLVHSSSYAVVLGVGNLSAARLVRSIFSRSFCAL